MTGKRMGSRVWTFRFLTSSSFPASKVRSKRRKYSLQSAPPLTKRSAWHNATSVVGWLWMQVQQNPPMPVCWSDSLMLNWWILTVAMAQTPWPVTLMYKASIVRPTVPKWLWTTSQSQSRAKVFDNLMNNLLKLCIFQAKSCEFRDRNNTHN